MRSSRCFNSRAHGGRDHACLRQARQRPGFQFTRPRGARRTLRASSARRARFNSRAHGGRDRRVRRGREEHQVSIHAPTGGATYSVTHCDFTVSFNSRAHGGRDLGLDARAERADVSIHAPTGGATKAICRSRPRCGFQFTRPRGARHARRDRQDGGRDVSIHAPTGGATAYILSYPIVDLQGGFPRTCPFFGLSSLIVNDQVFCARRERPILLPRTS